MDLVSQNLLLTSGGKKDSTYVDDVFSTYLYEETGSTVTVNNSVDMSKGGMVWFKNREAADDHALIDTVRGGTKVLHSNNNNTQSTQSGAITSFNNNGFTIGNYGAINGGSNKDVASWTFRKSKGFFDIVSFTGNGSVRTISHSLGSVPGMIMIKNLSSVNSWFTYHQKLGPSSYVMLNHTNAENPSQSWFMNDTAPTATEFTLGTGGNVNANGDEFIAYVFAGGASTAATAKSVHFTNQNGWMNTPADSAFAFGTGDFTVECWCKFDDIGNNGGLWNIATGTGIGNHNTIAAAWTSGSWKIYAGTGGQPTASGSFTVAKGPWYHVAYVRQSNNTKLYVNGTEVISTTDTTNYSSNQALAVGAYASEVYYTFDGKISNLRVIKGTALYTSSFKPPTEPLTNITNTTMLCCNDSSATGKTVGPSLTAWGGTAASSDSPFDDPAGFKFGEEEDQNIIKTGSYTGNGSATGPEVYLGWEPSLIILKNAEKIENWLMFDSMRGIVTGGNDARLFPNLNTAESSPGNFLNLTSTGFQINDNGGDLNEPNDEIIYIAIRRPDGYVGKPLELGEGTKALSMVYGNTSNPTFTTPFPVDFTTLRRPGTTENWTTAARLIQGKYLHLNQSAAENSDSNIVFDYNNGFHDGTGFSTYLSWSWKRHAGFDVVCYRGNGATSQTLGHSLGRTPEMIWVKRRDSSGDWFVYNKGLDGGTNPETHYLTVNNDDEEADYNAIWNDTAPTSTHFTVGNYSQVNGNTNDFIAMLFASVDGISKVGSYDGQGSDLTIEFGFSPRFLIVKRVDSPGDWNVFDTTRGLDATSNDKELRLNNTSAQSNHEVGLPTSTGFTFACGGSHDTCSAGQKYIYYAHA